MSRSRSRRQNRVLFSVTPQFSWNSCLLDGEKKQEESSTVLSPILCLPREEGISNLSLVNKAAWWVYVYMQVCAHACTCVHCVCEPMDGSICAYVCTQMCLSLCTHMCMYDVCIYASVHMRACVCISMCCASLCRGMCCTGYKCVLIHSCVCSYGCLFMYLCTDMNIWALCAFVCLCPLLHMRGICTCQHVCVY